MFNNFLPKYCKNKESDSNFWDKFDVKGWKDINYPWRISDKELSNISKILDNLCDLDRVALLGSTPEIRSLAANKGIKLDVIDFSSKMYTEMDKISCSIKNENFVNEDWIKYFSQQERKYDLVIGDLIERLLPEKKLTLLENALGGALKQKGKILLRSYYHNAKEQNSRLDTKSEINRLVTIKLTNNEIADRLFLGLSDEFTDNTRRVSVNKMKKYLLKTKANTKLTKKEVDILDLVVRKWTSSPLGFYCPSFDDLESIWAKDFISILRIRKKLFDDKWISLILWQTKK